MNLSEIQIDRGRLIENFRALKSLLLPGTHAIVVVKGNAYGHGFAEVVKVLAEEADGFQVDDIEELRLLRSLTAKRALVLGYITKRDIDEAVGLDCEISVFDLERLSSIAEAGKRHSMRPKIHLKIDALLGRLGFLPADIPNVIFDLKRFPELDLRAAYAHFANIEDTTDVVHANDQWEAFDSCCQQLQSSGWPELGTHISATSGVMTNWKGHSLARLGLGVYGMYPSGALARRHTELGLKPVIRWVSHLAQVKMLPAHHPVGYGLTFITPKPMRIGIVPQGYSDGVDRGLSSIGEVLVRGTRCSILGRIAMNMFAVDLSNVADAKAEDEVVLLGSQGEESIGAEEIASRLGTINYEITTRISPLLPRRIV